MNERVNEESREKRIEAEMSTEFRQLSAVEQLAQQQRQ